MLCIQDSCVFYLLAVRLQSWTASLWASIQLVKQCNGVIAGKCIVGSVYKAPRFRSVQVPLLYLTFTHYLTAVSLQCFRGQLSEHPLFSSK